tara:strand:- start:62 stop:598 length:537 start_codon:yes stop_codon:yes gene_type:complete
MNIDLLFSALMNVIGIVGFAVIGFLIYRRLSYHSKMLILDPINKELKWDFIRKENNKKTGEVRHKLIKAKQYITKPMDLWKFKQGKKWVYPRIIGEDGYARRINVAMNYADEHGEIQPYIHPVDLGMQDEIFYDMKVKTAKYKFMSTLEKLAPVGAMVLIFLTVIVSLHLHNKAIGGG